MSKMPLSAEVKAAAEEVERETVEAEAERQFQDAVLKRSIAWDVYAKNGDITQREQGLLLDYDKQSPRDQQDLLAEKGPQYAATFVKCLNTLRNRDTVEYLIVVVSQLLSVDEQRASYFHQAVKDGLTNDVFAPFTRVLTSGEVSYTPNTLHTASSIVATLFASAHNIEPNNQSLATYVSYLIARLGTAVGRDLLHVLGEVKILLRGTIAQGAWIKQGGVAALAQLLLKDTQNAQLIYLTEFAIWLLSYHQDAAKPLQDLGVLRKLVQIVKVNVMEKIFRISYAIFRNLLLGPSSVTEELIGHGLVSLTDTLSKRKFKDQDLIQDMEFLLRNLQDAIQKLSTFEIYQSEVLSGSLKESPVHTNEAFWRENVGKFDNKLVSRLVSIARDTSESNDVREVAAWDLGEFARFHPDGRRIVTRLGGKQALMLLMMEKNPKLSKAALLATQKIMVTNWEYLQKSSAAGVQSLVTNKSK